MAGKFALKKAKDGQFHFTLNAANGQVVLSSELYKAKASALKGIESVKKNSQREGAFETRTAKNGKPYFVLKATNGQIVGQSEMYESAASCQKGIDSVKKNAPGATLQDMTAA